jgi:hypothetical protein
VFQRQINIIKSLEQTITLKVINLEGGGKTMSVADILAAKIDLRLVVIELTGAKHQLGDSGIVEDHRQETVLQTVIREDICK